MRSSELFDSDPSFADCPNEPFDDGELALELLEPEALELELESSGIPPVELFDDGDELALNEGARLASPDDAGLRAASALAALL